MKKWFEEKLCRLHIDTHVPAVARELGKHFDAAATADKFAAAKFDMVQVFTKCHFGNSYYFTDIGVRHPALRVDMFGEMCEALVARGITATAYYSLMPDEAQAKLHPDWVIHYDKKQSLGFDHVSGCTTMCMQSPYVDTIVLPQVREIAENYPVSGIFFDFGRSFYYCGCKWCQEAFLAETGLILPENDEKAPHWGDYILWKRGDQRRFEEKMDALRKSFSKEFSFVVNYSYTIRNPESGPNLTDFITMDVGERSEPCGLNVSFNAKYLATVNKSYEIMTTRMISWWASWGLKPYNTLLYQNAIIQTHGGKSILADRWDLDWNSDDVIMNYFADMNAFITGVTQYLDGAVPEAKTAILFCRESQRNANKSPSNDVVKQLAGMEAAHKILVQNHIPCLIIDEENLERYLDRLELLIVPEQTIHDPVLQKQLDGFVKKGGLLIGSLETGLGSNMEKLFGIECLQEFMRGFISIPQEFMHGKYPFPEIPLDARFLEFKCQDALEIAPAHHSIYAITSGLGFGPIDRTRTLPGVSVRQHGEGHAIYCGAEIFGNYRQTNNPQIKHFLKSLIMAYKPELMISPDAPDSVEFAISESSEATYLHCFHYSPEKELSMECSYIDTSSKVGEFHVEIPYPEKVKEMRVFPEDAEKPEFEQKDGKIVLKINDLEVFRSIAIYRE